MRTTRIDVVISGAFPAGELVLRRRRPHSRAVSVYRWHLFEDASEAWRSFPLEPRDVLVFEWRLRAR